MLKKPTISHRPIAPEWKVILPVQDVQQVTRHRFSILSNAALVNTSLQRGHQFIAILFDHKAHELLLHIESLCSVHMEVCDIPA